MLSTVIAAVCILECPLVCSDTDFDMGLYRDLRICLYSHLIVEEDCSKNIAGSLYFNREQLVMLYGFSYNPVPLLAL